IAGMKALLSSLFGYNRSPRRPLRPVSEEMEEVISNNETIQRLLAEEKNLTASMTK
ncbi:hypothetical protein LTS18_013927, partial [Coniosporium uncinatum]